MAEAHWIGVSGDFSAAGNWSTTRYGAAAGGAPTTNSDVIIEDVGVAPSTNLDGITADLGSIQINTARDLGSVGTPLKVQVSGTSGITHAGLGSLSGVIVVRSSGSLVHIATQTGGIDKLVVDETGQGQCVLSGTTATTVVVQVSPGCNATVESGTVVTTMRSMGALTAKYSATAFTTCTIAGGTATLNRSAATLNVDPSALCRMVEADNVALVISTLATVLGKLVFWASGDITAIETRGTGEATAKGSKYEFTVTASTKYAGSKMFEDSTNFVKTAPTVVVGGTAA